MNRGIEFHTVTCLNWNHLLADDSRKDILIESFKYLINEKKIYLFAFVFMSNHIHFIWEVREEFATKNIKQNFLKYVAQKIKYTMTSTELENYRSSQNDRIFHFWERRSWKAEVPNREILEQKVEYIHLNPVKAGIVEKEEDYKYSSARYYLLENKEWKFIKHYMDRI
jgi:putative transposase